MELTTTWKEEGIQIGRQAAALDLTMRLLTRHVGALPPALAERVRQLPLEQVERLFEAVLDFSSVDDLRRWLDAHPPAAPDAPTPD